MKLDEIKDPELRRRINEADQLQNHRVPFSAINKQNPCNESMAENEGAHNDAVRRAVVIKITSFRLRLVDGDNLFAKYFTDALISAGITIDDSAQWCKVETYQEQIEGKEFERTEIELLYVSGGQLNP